MAVLAYLAKFLVYYTAATIALYMLSLVIPKAAFVARALAAYLCLLLAAGSGVFTSAAMRLLGCAHSAQWAVGRCFAFLMALATGIRFEIQDPHNVLSTVRPAVFVGNHQTELDVLMLGAMFPRHCSMTAKSSLKKTPFLGWFMTLSGAIFINRTKTNDAREAMARAATEMRERQQSVYLFPEGTRSYSKEPELLPFKKGAFHLAVEGQVPIVPCVVANYSHVLWIKGLVFRSGTIPIRGKTPPLFRVAKNPTNPPRSAGTHLDQGTHNCRRGRAHEEHPRADAQRADLADRAGPGEDFEGVSHPTHQRRHQGVGGGPQGRRLNI